MITGSPVQSLLCMYLNSHTPSDGCMFVTTPFMWRVVSVHRLNTATSCPIRAMSCSTVSDVHTARSPCLCAWISCQDSRARYLGKGFVCWQLLPSCKPLLPPLPLCEA
jgi:hypothetical protein